MEQMILSPKSDFIFKLIFGDERNIDILQSFLQAVLDIPPEEYKHITIVNPHLKREDELDKLSILDVKYGSSRHEFAPQTSNPHGKRIRH